MAVHTIRVKGGPTFRCPDHRPILFAAWEQGVTLPYSCRVGGCGQCVARILTGRVDPSQDGHPIGDGGPGVAARLCRAFPLSDCTILVPGAPAEAPAMKAGRRPPGDLERQPAVTAADAPAGVIPRSASADPACPAVPAPPG